MESGRARAALGEALGRRAEECARVAEQRLEALPWVGQSPSREYLETRGAAMWLGTLLVARWLVCAELPTEDELGWISERARRLPDEGLSLVNMQRGYLVWRDVTAHVLTEEARRLDVDGRVLDAAHAVVRATCDANLMRMARSFDDHLAALNLRLEQEREALRHSALHDQLTGLPNRLLLYDRLAHGLAVARREQRPMAVLLIDLDGFKTVNDTFGHRQGDRALAEVARRIQGAVREADTVARLGGDEFVAVLPGADPETAVAIADRVLDDVARALAVEDREFRLGASVGVALYPDLGDDADSLVLAADRAMYVAKRAGGGVHVGAPEIPSKL